MQQLHSLRAPFFDAWYFPEADLLRTYSLFMMCKFPDATKEIDAFATAYRPVHETLDSTLPTMTAQDGWADVRALVDGAPTKLPVKVMHHFLDEDRIHDAISTVDKAEDELERLANASANPFTTRANAWLQQRRDELIRIEGQRVLDRANAARNELADYLHNVDITKLDMMTYETQLYERAAATGELQFGDPVGKLRKLRKQRGTRVWPYEGEYWADEIGYYVYDARPDCHEGLQGGGTTGK